MKMASLASSIPSHLGCSPPSSSSSTSVIKPAAFSSSSSFPAPNKAQISSCIGFSTSISQMGFSWNGLRVARISLSIQLVRKDRKRRRCGEKGVYASLFGVGAPEALVIGVVALLVFGPKGLAEVARNLGKTLRAFQPTIRELQDVSREFKSTIEREIGLDDISNPLQNNYTSRPPTRTPISTPPPAPSSDAQQTMIDNTDGAPSPSRAYSSEEYLKITEEQLKAAAAAQQQETASPPTEDQIVKQQNQSQSTVQDFTAATPPPKNPESNTSS